MAAGCQRTSENLSTWRAAKRVANSPRPAARKFTTNAFVSSNADKQVERLSTQINKSGGSAETAHTALLVRPRGVPDPSTVVTTVTPVGKDPSTARKRSLSIDIAYFTWDGAALGMAGTQIGAMHCIPAAQSPGPWHGHEHFPAATLQRWVRHCASEVQGTPCGFGFIVPAGGGAVVGCGAG
jgi:hypothetical protein